MAEAASKSSSPGTNEKNSPPNEQQTGTPDKPAKEDENDPKNNTGKVLVERCLKDVEPREINWLWLNYIPRGMLTLFDGDPDQGKTFVTLDLAARVSQGWSMPSAYGGHWSAPANVLLVSAEDEVDQTIKPRLEAPGSGPLTDLLSRVGSGQFN